MLGAILASAVVLFGLLLYTIMPGGAKQKERNKFFGRSFAHRGLHTRDQKIPENSMAAFRRAVEAGYGIELDIQLSKDKKIVVFHDDTLTRACGVDKRVDELTLAELQELPLFGTEERIPLFFDVLMLIQGQVPLIVELKTGRQNADLCKMSSEMMVAYQGPICMESFNPAIVGWFRDRSKTILRGQLSAPAKSFRSLPKMQAFLLSHMMTNGVARPQFIAFRAAKKNLMVKLVHKIGCMSVVWTVDETMDAATYEAENDCVIFQYYEPDVAFKEPEEIRKINGVDDEPFLPSSLFAGKNKKNAPADEPPAQPEETPEEEPAPLEEAPVTPEEEPVSPPPVLKKDGTVSQYDE